MQKQKPTPEKFCSFCGAKLERKRYDGVLEDLTSFMKRKYCDRECMKRGHVKKGKNNQKYSTAHSSARNINKYFIQQTECQTCGSMAKLDVHHKDYDYTNNEIDNLVVLCRSCHTKLHREKFCVICGKKHKGLGFCDKHYQRYKKYGDPHYIKKAATCKICGEKAHAYGYCGKHYQQKVRNGETVSKSKNT